MTPQPDPRQPDPRLRLRVVSHSEVGLVRKNNQDSGYASPHLLVVADGMGGAAAGDLASAVAIEVIKRLDTPVALVPEPTLGGAEASTEAGIEDTVIVAGTATVPEQGAAGRNPLLGRFAAAIEEANSRIADLVAADYTLEGMGTTVTGALFDGERLALAHIGDSRAYLLREGRLERLTHDHSWVQSLVDEGKISPDEAAYHPHRSLLLKVLNGQPANDPDLTSVELRAGDRLLFCSDGLCGMVEDDEIAELAAHPDLDTAVADLADAALAAGGIDNITVILAEVEGADDEDTAVRGAVAAAPAPAPAPAPDHGVVLGAAVNREIPVVPRRPPLAPGLPDEEDVTDEGAPAAGATPATTRPAARTSDDESRYAPRAPAKRRRLRTLLVGLVVLLVAAAGLGAGYAWTRTQYFVGASDGQVAIYTGLPDSIPGISLSQVYETQDLPVASLPPYYQAQVTTGIEVASLEAARATVVQLRDAAERCAEPSPSPTPSVKPTPKESSSKSPEPTKSPTTTTPSPTASRSATPTATVALTPSPTPTATPLPGEC